MPATTMNDRGEIIISLEIREQLNLQPGDKIEFMVTDGGKVYLQPVKTEVESKMGVNVSSQTKIIKEIKFSGIFQKEDIEDSEKLENISAVIYCYANGKISLQADYSVRQQINQKIVYDTFPHSDENNEIIYPGYQGYFLLKGKTDESLSLSVSVFPKHIVFINTQPIPISETTSKTQKDQTLMLINLEINNEAINDNSKIKQIKYGLSNLGIDREFSSKLKDGKVNFSFNPLAKEDKTTLDAELSGELIISNLESEEDYQKYSRWIRLVLSFASGDKANCIYEKTTWEDDIETERWFGGMAKAKKYGLRVIEPPYLRNFVGQISTSIKPEIFANKNLGGSGLEVALAWYLESFESTGLQTKFICLCTAFEALISSFNKEQKSSNNKLIPKGKKRKIRKDIKEVLDKNKDDPEEVSKEQIENYQLFCKNMDSAIDYANKIDLYGSFSKNLEGLLAYYKVDYQDPFTESDLIEIRNLIIHQGIAEFNKTYKSYWKLENLFIRLVLSILGYQGVYQENDGENLKTRLIGEDETLYIFYNLSLMKQIQDSISTHRKQQGYKTSQEQIDEMLVFEGDTWIVYEKLREKGQELYTSLWKIIQELLRDDPTKELGKPERLKSNLSWLWSRRITQKDRVVYKFDDDYVYIFAIGGHYENLD